MNGEHLDRFWHGVCIMIGRDYVSHSTRGDGPHFVAASSVQGALAGTHSLDGWWGGGTGSLKATAVAHHTITCLSGMEENLSKVLMAVRY